MPLQIKLALFEIIKQIGGKDCETAKALDAMTVDQVLEIIAPILNLYRVGFVTYNQGKS